MSCESCHECSNELDCEADVDDEEIMVKFKHPCGCSSDKCRCKEKVDCYIR